MRNLNSATIHTLPAATLARLYHYQLRANGAMPATAYPPRKLRGTRYQRLYQPRYRST